MNVFPLAGTHLTASDPAAAQAAAEAAEGAALTTASSRMSVRVGELNLLIPADAGREVMPPPSMSRVPHTVYWLRGLANVRGNLVPVVDIAAAFDLVRAGDAPPYLLISGQGEAAMGLLIDGLPRLTTLDALEPSYERPPLPSLLEDSVVAVYRHADHVSLDVDLPRLFEALGRNIAL